jgi:hypothetical protein
LRAETWLSPLLQEASIRINIFEYESQYAIDLTQTAVKYIISSWAGSIDWPRVKKITFDWTLRCERTSGDTSVEAVNFRLFVGQGASVTEPSGSNEPWEGTGWSQVYSGPVSGSTPATGTIETSIGESGGNLYFAVSADNTTSPNLVDQDAFFVLERFNIVYNLATA